MTYKPKGLNWTIVIRLMCFILNRLYMYNDRDAVVYWMTEILMQAFTLFLITINYDIKFIFIKNISKISIKELSYIFLVITIIAASNMGFYVPYWQLSVFDIVHWFTFLFTIFSFILTFQMLYVVNSYSIEFSNTINESRKNITKYLDTINHLNYFYIFALICFTLNTMHTHKINYMFIYPMQVIGTMFIIPYYNLISKGLVLLQKKGWGFHFLCTTTIIFAITFFSHEIQNVFFYLGLSASLLFFSRVYFRVKALPIDTSSF